jgi:tetratricopeptide (TPR) repeat protein
MAHQYLGSVFQRRLQADEALAEFLKARELDPLSPVIARVQASPYLLSRQYAKALEVLRQANELGPALINTWEVDIYVMNKALDELTKLAKAEQDRKHDPVLIHSAGMLYAAQGKRAEALDAVAELERMTASGADQSQFIAKVYATLNEKGQALAWLERGAAAGSLGAFIREEPVWDAIRDDRRFGDLAHRMGLP